MPNFALFLGVGTAVGLFWVALRARERQITGRLDDAVLVLIGALLGGRAVFVVLTWTYFREHLTEIPQAWLGGFSGPGALAGGLVALCLLSAFRRLSPGALADSLAPLAIALGVSAWLVCWADGIAYGKPVDGWYGVPARDEWGELSKRWPTQLTGAAVLLAVSWLHDQLAPRRSLKGFYASLVLACLGLSLFSLSLTRDDPASVWMGLRLDAWAGLCFTFIALCSMGIIAYRRRRTAERFSSAA